MVALGMWACQWRELRPLTFGGTKGKEPVKERPEDPERGEGFVMGSGGRSRDGGGAYEMVGMAPKEPD